jgi:hypothetical protein
MDVILGAVYCLQVLQTRRIRNPNFFPSSSVKEILHLGLSNGSSNKDCLRGWSVRGSHSGWGDIFHTRPDQRWDPPGLLYTMDTGSLSWGVKPSGRGFETPPTSSVKDRDRVELYLYSASWISRLVLGWTLPLHLPNWSSSLLGNFFIPYAYSLGSLVDCV